MRSAAEVRLRALVLLAIFVCVAGVTAVGGQQERQLPSQFRAEVGRVLVDVSVIDREGRFVPGLTSRDFRVYEEGAPVEIVFSGLERFRQAIPWAVEHPVGLELSQSPVLPRHLVLFVDGFNTAPNDWAMIKRPLIDYLRGGLQQNDRILLALLTPERRLFVAPEFTRDSEAIISAIEHVRTNPQMAERVRVNERRVHDVLYRDTESGALLTEAEPGASGAEANRLRQAVALAERFAGERKQEVLYTLEAMSRLAAHLNRTFDVPGPKVMIMVSSGIPQNPGSNYFYMIDQRTTQVPLDVRAQGGTEGYDPIAFRSQAAETIEQHLLRALGRLNRLNYTLYTIGVLGPGDALPTDLSLQVRSSLSQSVRQIVHRDQQEGLRMMAAGTGGLAFDNSYDFARALEHIDADTALRYVLGYDPPERPDDVAPGKFYRIKVEVNVPGVKVRARRGYVE